MKSVVDEGRSLLTDFGVHPKRVILFRMRSFTAEALHDALGCLCFDESRFICSAQLFIIKGSDGQAKLVFSPSILARDKREVERWVKKMIGSYGLDTGLVVKNTSEPTKTRKRPPSKQASRFSARIAQPKKSRKKSRRE